MGTSTFTSIPFDILVRYTRGDNPILGLDLFNSSYAESANGLIYPFFRPFRQETFRSVRKRGGNGESA
jgi:hypothetical protein